MPILKEVTLESGHVANYHRIVSLHWMEDLVSAELVANPDYVDAETTPDVPEQIWSPVHSAATTMYVELFKDRDAYYSGANRVSVSTIYVKGDDNPFRHENLGKTYAELYADAYAYLATLPEYADGEIIA